MIIKIRQLLEKLFVIKFFLILTGFIYLSTLAGPTDFYYNPIQTQIELVVSIETEDGLGLSEIDVPAKPILDFSQVDFFSINKFALFHYNKSVLHQLKFVKNTFTPNQQLTSILQKKCIWHQSSEEPPALSS